MTVNSRSKITDSSAPLQSTQTNKQKGFFDGRSTYACDTWYADSWSPQQNPTKNQNRKDQERAKIKLETKYATAVDE